MLYSLVPQSQHDTTHIQQQQHLLCSTALTDEQFHFLSHVHEAGNVHTLIDRVWSSSVDFSEQILLLSAAYLPLSLLRKSSFSPTLHGPKGQVAASGAVSVNVRYFSANHVFVITGAVSRKRGENRSFFSQTCCSLHAAHLHCHCPTAEESEARVAVLWFGDSGCVGTRTLPGGSTVQLITQGDLCETK